MNGFLHYLGNTGKPALISVRQLLNDSSAARSAAGNAVETGIRFADRFAQSRIDQGLHGPLTFAITSEWNNGPAINHDDSLNWFGLYRGHQMLFQGPVHVSKDSRGCWVAQMQMMYVSFKEYNFDKGEVFSFPGKIPVSGTALGELHEMGLAHNFDIWGSSVFTAKWQIGQEAQLVRIGKLAGIASNWHEVPPLASAFGVDPGFPNQEYSALPDDHLLGH